MSTTITPSADPTVTMAVRCSREKGWHVRMEWSDGYVDHFEPRNGPGYEILDIRDCKEFINSNAV